MEGETMDLASFLEVIERVSKPYSDPVDALLQLLVESPSIPSSMNQVLDNLIFLKAFIMHPPISFLRDGTWTQIASLSSEIEFFIPLVDHRGMNSHMASDLEMRLTIALKPMSRWMSMARSIYERVPKPPRNYHPRTDQLGFVDHLVEYLEALLVKARYDYSIGILKPYILRLQRRLRFLICRLMEIPQSRKKEVDLKDLVQSISSLAYEAECAIDSFLVRRHPNWIYLFQLRDILEELKHRWRQIKMESGDTQSILSCVLPTEPIELKVVPIVNNSTKISEKLKEVFDHPAVIDSFSIRTWSLVSSYKEMKKEVILQLLRNASYAPYVEEDSDEIEHTNDLSEDELKSSLLSLLENSRYLIILEDLLDIDAMNDIKEVLPKNGFGSRVLLTTPSPELALQCHYDSEEVLLDHTAKINKPIIDDEVVGFKAEIEGMLELLMRGPKKLQIISIFGMAGLGKTTLAKKLYSNLSVVDYFYTHSWCYVSQVSEKRELLLELLSQVVQLSDKIQLKNDEELAELLFRHLKGQRFLIVLDDLWDTRAWNDIRRCFPNDNNGSRIIFTTRIQELASHAKSDYVLQPICPLSDDESWELLKKKVFQNESCPFELLGVGTEIAKICRGLPLSIVLTAGLLKKMDKKVEQWKDIAKTLSSCILGDAEGHGKGIIELSYQHLSDPLKPCFLYFGAFLEGREVPVRKLIRLWIAEGFIQYTELKSLEDVAEDYLMDLIGRSLVTVAQKKSIGGAKSCHVHDLLREFCLIKAREENFLQLVNGYDEHFPLSNDNPDYSMGLNYSYSSTPITYNLRRLCIYSKRNHFIIVKPFGALVQSLLFFPVADMCPSYLYDASFIFHNFNLLRILDLEDINIGDSFKAVDILILLRYLAVQVDFIPSSIANLWSLETFLMKGSSGKVVKIPDSIWDMAKLRHVHIKDSVAFDLEPHRLENSSLLDNLQTLSTPSLAYGDDTEKILRRLRGIRKLKCIFLDSWDDATNCNHFPQLEFLNQLVSLKVFYNGEWKYPCKFKFPSNLKKLTLSNFRMPWNEISQLATLRNLEVLKLLKNAFEGEKWEMEDEVFPKLKVLKLDTLNVVEWCASSDHFPRLEHLLLHQCKQLEEIPRDIGDVPTLQMIEVIWCNPSVAISAKTIQEDQLEFGNEGLNIHVHPKMWDLESSSSNG